MPSDAFATPRSVVEKGGVYCGRKRSSGELAGCFEAFPLCNTTMRMLRLLRGSPFEHGCHVVASP